MRNNNETAQQSMRDISETDYEAHRQEARDAFDQAVSAGRLSAESDSPIYAGNYMYMGLNGGKAAFKNIITRAYDV